MENKRNLKIRSIGKQEILTIANPIILSQEHLFVNLVRTEDYRLYERVAKGDGKVTWRDKKEPFANFIADSECHQELEINFQEKMYLMESGLSHLPDTISFLSYKSITYKREFRVDTGEIQWSFIHNNSIFPMKELQKELEQDYQTKRRDKADKLESIPVEERFKKELKELLTKYRAEIWCDIDWIYNTTNMYMDFYSEEKGKNVTIELKLTDSINAKDL